MGLVSTMCPCLPWHGSARALPHYRFALPKKSCLRKLLWKQCSYIIHKSTSCVRIDPFLRYMWFEGRPSESSWLGWAVDFREGSRDQKSFFFFHRLFLFFCLPSCPPLCTTFTSVSPLCSTCPPCTPVFNCVCPISPPTLLHLPCACSALSSPLNLFSTHRSHAFWLPSRLFQRQWTGLSRWISGSRSPPIPTTCLYYNLSDTSSFFVLCSGKCKQLLQPPLLGGRRKTPEEGLETSHRSLTSLSPFSPYPSSLFPTFNPCIRSL